MLVLWPRQVWEERIYRRRKVGLLGCRDPWVGACWGVG